MFFVVDRRSWRVDRKVCGRIVLLLCGVFGVLSCVCGVGILVGVVLGRCGWCYVGCADVGVFACGCRKRGGGNLLVLVPSPSLFVVWSR